MSLANSTPKANAANTDDSALMRRFLALADDKRRVFQTRAREQGIDLASLPIPGGLRAGNDAPLSYAQQRLWVVEQLSPGTGAYNIPAAVRLHGTLNVMALSQAFAAIVARHEALRTSFHEGPDGAVQRVHAEMPFSIDYEDWYDEAADRADQDARVQACARDEAVRPFALDTAPLMRARLIRLAPDNHVLLLTLHHIVADAWSMTRLVEECTRGYARLCGSSAVAGAHIEPLPDLPIQYADYAIWQRGWLEAGEMERQLAYWRGHLGDEHPVLPLPADRARPAVPTGRGATYVMEADAGLTVRLRELARTHDTTLYTVLLAAYGVWLARISGVRNVCVGVPVAGRAKLETEPLIGFFVNTQVMRVPVDPKATFASLVATMRTRSIEAKVHADVPFDKLVEALQPARDAAVNALFQAKFNHEIARDAVPEMAGLRIEPVVVAGQSSHFDLSLDTLERGDTLQIALTYATDLFDASTVEPLACAFAELLGQLTNTPDVRLADVASVTGNSSAADGERRAWGSNDWMDAWASRVAQDGDALAVDGEDGNWSRRTLDAHANRIARALVALGVGTEDRVALLMPRSAGWVAAMLGVWKIGAAYVPLDPTQPPARLAQLIEASGAKALIVAPGLSSTPQVDGCRTLAIADLLAGDDARFAHRSVHPSQAAYVIYTSGSTGQPKGVVVGRGALHNYVQGVASRLTDLPDDAGMAMVSTVAADLGHTVLFGALAMGRPLHLMPHDDAFDAGRFAQWMRARRIGVMKIVPSHLKGLLLAAGPDVLPHDWLIVGGEAADAELLTLLHTHRPALRVLNHYGPTETTVGVLTHGAAAHDVLLPVGTPLPNVSAYVLDDDVNAVLPGVSGELYIGGVALARGYLDEPGKTAERFVPDPWRPGARMYRTGDRVKRRPDGEIVYLGRGDDQIKIRGYRVEPGEVAHALRTLDGVRDAVVLVERDARGQSQLIGCYTGALAQIDAKAALQSSLPAAWVPSRLVRLDALPLTANGKVDRRALLEMTHASSSPAQPQTEAAPASELEARIADVWKTVLKTADVSRDANFFEIGGDSILALQVIARLKRGTPPLKISLRELMQHGTVARLAAALSPSDTGAAAGGDLLVRLNDSKVSAPALFCVHPAVGTVFDYRPLGQALAAQRPVVGIQSRMLLDPKWSDTSLDEMAARYVDAVRAAQPRGPYHLLGWSLGGPIALAMAERLVAGGETVAFLGLADAFVPQEAAAAPVASSRDWTGDLLDYLVTILPQVDAAKLRESLAPHAGNPLDEGVLAAAVDAALTMQQAGAASAGVGDYAALGRDELAHMFRVTAHLRALADAHRLRPAVVPVHAWWVERRAAEDRARLTRAIGAAPRHEGTVASSHMQLPRTKAWIDDVARALREVSAIGGEGVTEGVWRQAS